METHREPGAHPAAPAVYRFADFEVDAGRRELRRNGRILACSGQPFDVLVMLVCRAGELVSRDSIQQQLWPHRTVEFDPAINGCIRHLRYLLDDDAGAPTYIKTAPKHGYVFIARVERADLSSGRLSLGWRKGAQSRTALAAAFGAALVLIGLLLLARLPEQVITVTEPKALNAYVKAQRMLETHDPSVAAEAAQLFREALAVDEEYAHAWAGLADAIYYTARAGTADAEESRRAAAQALALDPQMARAMARLADLTFAFDWDFERAGTLFARAIELDPGDVSIRHSYSAFLLASGDEEGAIFQLNTALAIDPLSAVMTSDLAWTLSLAGRNEDALEKCEILKELIADSPRSVACYLRPLLELGRIPEAAAVAGELMVRSGRIPEAEEPAELLQEYWQWRAAAARRPIPLAIAQARLGDAEGALTALERAHADRDPMFPFVHLYPEFRALRITKRYKAIRAVSKATFWRS